MLATHTFTYKTVDNGHGQPLNIDLDVLLPSQSPAGKKVPVVIWFHGGGLLQGTKSGVAPHMRRAVDQYGIAVISVDYRLAPQVRVPAVLSDISAALRFVITELPSRLSSAQPGAPSLDVDHIVLSGSSAGGWLALMLGLGMCSETTSEEIARVCGIAAIYPITDLRPDFFAHPQKPIGASELIPTSTLAPYLDERAAAVASSPPGSTRTQFYPYAQQEGLFQPLLLSEEQRSQGWLDRSAVPHFIASRAADASAWPPVYMIHGDVDTRVSVEQARSVHKALLDVGLDGTIYEEVEGKDHLWDQFEEDEDLPTFWRFVQQHTHALV